MRFYKVFIQGSIFSVLLTAGVCLASPKYSTAQENNDFFAKDSAKTVFDNGVTQSDIPRIQLLKPVKDQAELNQKEALKVEEGAKPEEASAAQKDESIVGKYGDPTKDAPVLAQDNAPKPFQGMMAALDAGDRQLAFQYARQYVRHVHNVDQRAKDAMAIQAIAMEKEAIISPDSWAKGQFTEERAEFKNQLNDDLSKELTQHQQRMQKVDPRIRDFFNEAAKAEGVADESLPNGEAVVEDTANVANVNLKQDKINREKELRAQARALIAGRTPVDPKGEVDIYFFFRTKDKASIEMGREINKLNSVYKLDKKVLLVGVTIEKEDDSAVAEYRMRNSSSFDIHNGSVFAKQMGVTASPTVMFVARTTGQAVQEQGLKNVYHLDEVLRSIRGVVK